MSFRVFYLLLLLIIDTAQSRSSGKECHTYWTFSQWTKRKMNHRTKKSSRMLSNLFFFFLPLVCVCVYLQRTKSHNKYSQSYRRHSRTTSSHHYPNFCVLCTHTHIATINDSMCAWRLVLAFFPMLFTSNSTPDIGRRYRKERRRRRKKRRKERWLLTGFCSLLLFYSAEWVQSNTRVIERRKKELPFLISSFDLPVLPQFRSSSLGIHRSSF